MGMSLRAGETARLNSVRNSKSDIKNCDGLPSRSLGADALKARFNTPPFSLTPAWLQSFPSAALRAKTGAGSRIRTDDLLITNPTDKCFVSSSKIVSSPWTIAGCETLLLRKKAEAA
jgi:hypothetical protein